MTVKEKLRSRYMRDVRTLLEDLKEEVLVTGSNEFAIPCVDEDGNDQFIVITFKIPKGSRDGEAYDGYAMAEDYKMRQKAKAEKEKAKEEKKKKEKEKKAE